MKIALALGAPMTAGPSSFEDMIELGVGAEALGVDSVWSSEGWGRDAFTPLAYLAARTHTVALGTAIAQLSARSAATTAMTASSLDEMSQGRFRLGLGASGPAVVEGVHGNAYDRPIERMRETIEVVRMGLRGERLEYSGRQIQLPREGNRSLRLSQPPRSDIPILVAAMSPRGLALAGELADGWIGHSFIPDCADELLAPLHAGLAAAGRERSSMELQAGGVVEIDQDVEGLVERWRPSLAFNIGAMGTDDRNFYRESYVRAGYAEAAAEVHRLWKARDREGAARAVLPEMVLHTHLLGTPEMVAERVRCYAAAGIDSLRVQPAGRDVAGQLRNLERITGIVADVAPS